MITEQDYLISFFGFETCYECGELIENNYGHDENTELCFLCNHWNEHLERLGDSDMPWYGNIIINNYHYMCDPGIHHAFELGMAGRHFYIRHLKTGDVIETNDLWCQGEISEQFQDRMLDNCEWTTVHGLGVTP